MSWFKRNLFFVIGGLLALGLLGASGYYIYVSWSRNTTQFEKLNEIYTALKQANDQKNSPGNDKVDNTAAAREQERQLHQWIGEAKVYFQPIAPIPNPTNGPMTSELFAGALHRTIDQLQHQAESANVGLPPQYDFSFKAQSDKVRFAPENLQALATQLGEVKTISEILFGAGINALEGVQRIRISDDDNNAQVSDYIDDHPVSTDLAVLTPYAVTFRGFSPEIARVLAAFASSPNGFIVKAINVQPASAALDNSGAPAPPPPPMPVHGGLQTVLDEQMLRVTLMIDVVKLTPKN